MEAGFLTPSGVWETEAQIVEKNSTQEDFKMLIHAWKPQIMNNEISITQSHIIKVVKAKCVENVKRSELFW